MDDQSLINNYFKGKMILVTGGTGSIGQRIVSTLLKCEPRKIIILNKDDSKQYLMKQNYVNCPNVSFLLGDIRDYDCVEYATRGIDIVFHAAALKQVPICEEHPFEAVKTNVIGSENVVKASIFNKVKKVINVSTDKAVNPTNTLGVTKLLSEKIFYNANLSLNNNETIFCSVRFGNVINSRGSVIPLFIDQAKSGKAITVTDPKMTRFIMSISDAAKLTLKSAFYSKGGETFIFKMQSLEILKLAKTIKEYYKKKGINTPPIKSIGKRSGEKLCEELIWVHEKERVVEDKELYVVLPEDVSSFYHFTKTSMPIFRSDQIEPIDQREIIKLLDGYESKSR
ncbi:capsule biosynthesis protein CapD [Salipaludibacillus neizhouensis]|uniref:Capsule biosynthesis protein CapD n=1 Tax=Salipaludibacillus neizhouensis TaxID=885475 RepID=A0A3A9KA82_9BACI|nr:polysaccharide biosynthesis protein [Salipaludibacillus neizhouensis]RKL69109.1 capsule biosynthesis protein CapD [Salipaludibacillus neizhouensis]